MVSFKGLEVTVTSWTTSQVVATYTTGIPAST